MPPPADDLTATQRSIAQAATGVLARHVRMSADPVLAGMFPACRPLKPGSAAPLLEDPTPRSAQPARVQSLFATWSCLSQTSFGGHSDLDGWLCSAVFWVAVQLDEMSFVAALSVPPRPSSVGSYGACREIVPHMGIEFKSRVGGDWPVLHTFSTWCGQEWGHLEARLGKSSARRRRKRT